jgi:polyhydroxyalkanoate synthase
MMAQQNDALGRVERFFEAVRQGKTNPGEYAQAMVGPEKLPLATTPNHCIYQKDEVRLLKYEPRVRRFETPILFVYSLINRYYILDFMPGRSLIAFMLDQGFPVYCIDWGRPGVDEQDLTWEDYLGRYLRRCIKHTLKDAQADDLTLYGYCMGGTMALAYLSLYPEGVRSFVAQATPVDFTQGGGILAKWTQPDYFNVDALVDAFGNVPTDLMEAGFRSMDPVGTYKKWESFFEKSDDKDFIELFLAMEYWSSDNIPFPGEVYRQYIKDCYQTNNFMNGKMMIGGQRVDLSRIQTPLLNLMATKDNIAPPESSTVLKTITSVKDYTELRFKCGHIGISTSSKGPREFWPQVAAWIADHSAPRS